MSETASNARGALYIISCAASSATLVPNLVRQAQTASWEVCVITTPRGTKFLDSPLLERLTGYPVRSEYKRPEEPDVLCSCHRVSLSRSWVHVSSVSGFNQPAAVSYQKMTS